MEVKFNIEPGEARAVEGLLSAVLGSYAADLRPVTLCGAVKVRQALVIAVGDEENALLRELMQRGVAADGARAGA